MSIKTTTKNYNNALKPTQKAGGLAWALCLSGKDNFFMKLQYRWIDEKDIDFHSIFSDSIQHVDFSSENKNKSLFENIMKKQTCIKEQNKLAQFFTPADVSLFTAYNLLKDFDCIKNCIFDPCIGYGSLLISSGIVLATKYGLKNEELLNKLYGSEISESVYFNAINNIINGLSEWINGIDKELAIKILSDNIKNTDFLMTDIPKNSYIIANPPYKEDKQSKYKNLWIPFMEKIVTSNNTDSFGVIIPVSICSAKRTKNIRDIILKKFGLVLATHHEIRPRPLFKHIDQRISIFIATKKKTLNKYNTTGFLTYKSGDRYKIWDIDTVELDYNLCSEVFPKVSKNDIDFYYYQQLYGFPIKNISDGELIKIWVRTTGRYKLLAQYKRPDKITSKWKEIEIPNKRAINIISAFNNGEAIRWWKIFGDGRDISLTNFMNNFKVLS